MNFKKIKSINKWLKFKYKIIREFYEKKRN